VKRKRVLKSYYFQNEVKVHLPDDAVPKVISLGVAKFNVGSALKRAFWIGLQEALEDTPAGANPHRVCEEVERLIALYKGNGRSSAP
jgi:fructose/tagatose bisphosphate aldolase